MTGKHPDQRKGPRAANQDRWKVNHRELCSTHEIMTSFGNLSIHFFGRARYSVSIEHTRNFIGESDELFQRQTNRRAARSELLRLKRLDRLRLDMSLDAPCVADYIVERNRRLVEELTGVRWDQLNVFRERLAAVSESGESPVEDLIHSLRRDLRNTLT